MRGVRQAIQCALAVGTVGAPILALGCAVTAVETSEGMSERSIRLLAGEPSPLGSGARLDLAHTPAPESDALLTEAVAFLEVEHLAKADLASKLRRPAGAVMAASTLGVYEMVVRFPPVAEDQVRVFEPVSSGSAADDLDPGKSEIQGWSAGIDNRIQKSPHWGIGRLSAFRKCTAELIGLRLVRTAAHCVIEHDESGGGWIPNSNIHFEYMRNGATIPVTTEPLTTWIGGNYFSSDCAKARDFNNDGDLGDSGELDWGYTGNLSACANEDWALLVLPANWRGSVSISSFGYRTMGTGDLSKELTGAGYPVCGKASSPADCVQNGYYYRDTTTDCELKGFDGNFVKFNTGCDISPGNSGGPVWDDDGYFLGHAQYDECAQDCASSEHNPNHFLGTGQWLFDFQSSLNATYP